MNNKDLSPNGLSSLPEPSDRFLQISKICGHILKIVGIIFLVLTYGAKHEYFVSRPFFWLTFVILSLIGTNFSVYGQTKNRTTPAPAALRSIAFVYLAAGALVFCYGGYILLTNPILGPRVSWATPIAGLLLAVSSVYIVLLHKRADFTSRRTI